MPWRTGERERGKTERSVFPLVGRIYGQFGFDVPNAKKARRRSGAGGMSVGSDEADFSSFSVELARIDAELKNVPDVREGVVAAYKEQVEAGTYVPPLDQVARSLLVAGLLNVR